MLRICQIRATNCFPACWGPWKVGEDSLPGDWTEARGADQAALPDPPPWSVPGPVSEPFGWRANPGVATVARGEGEWLQG